MSDKMSRREFVAAATAATCLASCVRGGNSKEEGKSMGSLARKGGQGGVLSVVLNPCYTGILSANNTGGWKTGILANGPKTKGH